MATYLYVNWKSFSTGTVNLSSEAGVDKVRYDHHQGGASEDTRGDSGDDLLHKECALQITNVDCINHDQEPPISVAVTGCDGERVVKVTSLYS